MATAEWIESAATRPDNKPALLIAELRRIRIERGMTQQDVADLLGVARITVQARELGYRRTSAEELQRWAELLGYEITLQRREEKEEAA